MFEQNGVSVTHIPDLQGLKDGEFDVVVCLDVLEHVPLAAGHDPVLLLLARAPGGFLITHSSYFYLEPYHPTHLASNRRYAGDDAMFRPRGSIRTTDACSGTRSSSRRDRSGSGAEDRADHHRQAAPAVGAVHLAGPQSGARIMSASDSPQGAGAAAMGAS